MKGIFNLIYKSGPHGDECTTYKLEFAPNITLERFINGVISDNLKWGKIYVGYINTNIENFLFATENEKYSWFEIEYKYGRITNISNKSLYNKYKDKIIENNDYNWSNGGWSCMDYWIRFNI